MRCMDKIRDVLKGELIFQDGMYFKLFPGQTMVDRVMHRRYIIVFYLLNPELALVSGLVYAGWIKHCCNPMCQHLYSYIALAKVKNTQ